MKYICIGLVVLLLIVSTDARERTGDSAKRDARAELRTEQITDLRWALNPANVDTVFSNLSAEQRKFLRIQTKALQVLVKDYAEIE